MFEYRSQQADYVVRVYPSQHVYCLHTLGERGAVHGSAIWWWRPSTTAGGEGRYGGCRVFMTVRSGGESARQKHYGGNGILGTARGQCGPGSQRAESHFTAPSAGRFHRWASRHTDVSHIVPTMTPVNHPVRLLMLPARSCHKKSVLKGNKLIVPNVRVGRQAD